ncbi:MAG: prevent-host-death protein [Variovorax sp.]|nr:prevent-host-death protein [Variovorax sp.]
MRTWSVRDAKARFDELIEACRTEGPQTVTERGTPVAVLVPAMQWSRSRASARLSLKALLLAADARTEFLTPERGVARRRVPPLPR